MKKKAILAACFIFAVIMCLDVYTALSQSEPYREIKRIKTLNESENYILRQGHAVIQKFRFQKGGLDQIRLYFEKLDSGAAGRLDISVKDMEGNIIIQWSPGIEDMEENEFMIPLFCEDLSFENHTDYIIEIGIEDNNQSGCALKIINHTGNSWMAYAEENGKELQGKSVYAEIWIAHHALLKNLELWGMALVSIAIILGVLCLLLKWINWENMGEWICFIIKSVKKTFYMHSTIWIFALMIFAHFVVYYMFFADRICSQYVVESTDIQEIKEFWQKGEQVTATIGEGSYTCLNIPIVLLGEGEKDREVELGIAINGKEQVIRQSLQYSGAMEDYEGIVSAGQQMQYFNANQKYISVAVNGEGTKTVTLDLLETNDNDRFLIGISEAGTNKYSYQIVQDTEISYWIYGILVFLSIFGTVIVRCIVWKMPNIKIENLYVVFAVILGAVYFILLPPGCTNDATKHIAKVYEEVNETLGKEDWIQRSQTMTKFTENDRKIFETCITNRASEGPPCTGAFDAVMQALKNRPVYENSSNPDEWKYECDGNRIEFLPYYFVMLPGRIFHLNFMAILQMAKIAGMISYVIIMRQAIRWFPAGKEAMFVYALNPMSLQTMVSINYDNITMSVGMLFLAWILKAKSAGYQVSKNEAPVVCLIICTLASGKGGIYLITVFVFFAIMLASDSNGRNFCRKHKKYILLWMGLAVTSIMLFNTNYVVDHLEESARTYTAAYILQNPVTSIMLIMQSVIEDCDLIVRGLFGGNLGWNESVMPWMVVGANILVFTVACLYGNKKRSSFSDLFGSMVTFVCFTFGLYTIFLLMHDRNSVAPIWGIQGRYFMCLIPVIICLVRRLRIRCTFKLPVFIYSTWFLSMLNVFFMAKLYLRR